jgi:hypothetical protein
MTDPKTNKPRTAGTTLSLENLIRSFQIEIPCQLHNSGNDAFLCLFALQKLLYPQTQTPTPKRNGRLGPGSGPSHGANMPTHGWVGGPGPVVPGASVVIPPPLTGLMPPLPTPPYSPGFPVVPGLNSPVEDHTEKGNESGQAKRATGPLRTTVSANQGTGRNPRAGTHETRHVGRGAESVDATMRSMTLR